MHRIRARILNRRFKDVRVRTVVNDGGLFRVRRLRAEDPPIGALRDLDEVAPQLGVARLPVGARLPVDSVDNVPLASDDKKYETF